MRALILGLLEEGENARQVVASLALSGHVTHAVDTFTKAMAVLTEPHDDIDLIISDVHLENGGNVFDFIKWIKRNPATSKIPFVLFSFKPASRAKYLEDGVKTSARLLGAAKYITMDNFDADEFRKEIDALLPNGSHVVALDLKGKDG